VTSTTQRAKHLPMSAKCPSCVSLLVLTQALKQQGVQQYNPEGQAFDPNYHSALFEIVDASKEPGQIGQVTKVGSRKAKHARVLDVRYLNSSAFESQLHTCTHILTHAHTYIHTRTRIHTLSDYIHTHNTHTRTYRQNTHIHTRTYTHIHAHTHTHTHTQTHTHTHTHTQRGYTLHDRVIRPAEVGVVRAEEK